MMSEEKVQKIGRGQKSEEEENTVDSSARLEQFLFSLPSCKEQYGGEDGR